MKSTVPSRVKVCLLFTLTLILAGTTFGAGYDLIEDGDIDWSDLGAFTEKWLADCSVIDCEGTNFDGTDEIINLFDFSLFGQYWKKKYSVYYVATTGNDSNPGTEAQPFATLEKARDTIRSKSLPDGGTTVYLRGGKYFRASEFTLTAADSGTADKPIVYMAYPGEDVRIIGGVELDHSNFSLVTDPAILNRMEAVADGNVYECNLIDLGITNLGQLRTRGSCGSYETDWYWFPQYTVMHDQARSHMELSFNEDMMQLARWPNDDFDHTTDDFDRTVESVNNVPQFVYDGNRPERWTSATNPWATGYWRFAWQDWYEAITDIDTDSNTITLFNSRATGLCQLNVINDKPWNSRMEGKAWYALNLLEEIDSAGEFYIEYEASNHYNGMLYIWPPTNDINSSDEIIVSALGENQECLVSTDNTSYVTFSGITFEMNRHNVFEISGGDSVLIDDCVIRNAGTNGIFIYSGVNHGIQNCNIYGIGSTGIRIMGGDRVNLIAANNFATNNHIYDFARWERGFRYAIVLEGCGNQATYNWIHNSPHQAIHLLGNDHDVKYNKIHNVCQISSDVGAIYMWMDWSFRGNEIMHNLIYDINESILTKDPDYANTVRGIYLDGYVGSADVFGNIISDIAGDGMFHQGGQDNNFENNIIVKCGTTFVMTGGPYSVPGKPCKMLEQKFGSLTFGLKAFDYQNPPWSTAYPLAAAVPNDCYAPAFARYEYTIYSEFNKNLSWKNDTWITAHGTDVWENHDINDNYEDVNPQFYDEANGILAVYDDSPVYEINDFVRVPWELMGNLDLDLATRPVPPDGGTNVVITPNLYWAPAFDANSHTVYFSATSSDVSTRAAGAGKGEFSDSHYAPGQLLPGTTYYWAIDENDVDGNPLGSGNLWSFTTRGIKAINPIPSNGEILVNNPKAVTLRWQRGAGADDRDIYFGTDNPPTTKVADDTTAMSYDANDLAGGVIYYWRIDSNDGGVVTTGDIWNFSTVYTIVGAWDFENGYTDVSGYAPSAPDGVAAGEGTIGIIYDSERDSNVLDLNGGYLQIGSTRLAVHPDHIEKFHFNGSYTLAAWCKSTDTTVNTGSAYIIANSGGWGPRLGTTSVGAGGVRGLWGSLALDYDGVIEQSTGRLTGDRGFTTTNSGDYLNDGEWHHIAAVFDGADLTIYFDGEFSASVAVDPGWLNTMNGEEYHCFGIGAQPYWGNFPFIGQIDDAFFSNYAMTVAQIQSIMANGIPGQ